MQPDDLDYELLRRLANEPSASQRGLARHMGVSLGRINYCLRALVDKGWIKVNNFRRSDNKWAYTYLLTPKGMTAKVQLTRDFLRRKEAEFDVLTTEIAALRIEVANAAEPNHRIKPGQQ